MAFSPYSLELLPVDGILNPAATIDDLNGRLINTRTILDGILTAPHGLWSDLRELILSVRFHVVTAIDLLDAWRRAGHQGGEPAADAPGVAAAVDSHVTALNAALPAWRNWLLDASQRQAQGDPPLPKLYGNTNAEPSLVQSIVTGAAAPTSNISFIGVGLVCLGLFGVASLISHLTKKRSE